jgi:hypothetical protein
MSREAMITSPVPFALASVVAATASFAAVADDRITLVGGDVLRGRIVSEGEQSVVLDHAALGRIEVRRDRIATVAREQPAAAAAPSPAPASTTAEASVAAVEPPAAEASDNRPVAVLPAPEPAAPPKPDGSWKFSLELGFTGSDNDESSNWDLRVAAKARRVSESDRTTVSAEYYFSAADGENTDNNLLVTGLQEYLFPKSKWEIFVQGTYQYDQLQDWEQRAGLYAGPGYRLYEGAPLEVKLRAGAGASYEFPSSSWTPELLLADDLVWTIDERSKLKQALEFYPDIDNIGEFRFIARLEYEISLSPKGDLKGTIGARDEYDSFVEQTETSANDIKVYAGLKYDF